MEKVLLDRFIQEALLEDIGEGDHTSIACVPEHLDGSAELIVKQDGILAGLDFRCYVPYQIRAFKSHHLCPALAPLFHVKR